MMLQVIIYGTAVAAAMAAVGLGLERMATPRGWSQRLVWATIMAVSMLFPLQAMWRTQPVPAAEPSTPAPGNHAVGALPVMPAVAAQPAAAPQAQKSWRVSLSTDSTLVTIWALASLSLLLYLGSTSLLLRRRARAWQRGVVLGEPVFVSESTGPALFGVLRPGVVVPRWFLEESIQTQALILAHEQQHLRSRDPLLLWSATLAVVLVPWNLPLWWQLRRLRLAIELDCDARVLSAGAEPGLYGKVLLSVTRRAMEIPVGVVAMSEPASALERRIRHLAPVVDRFTTLRVAGAAVLAVIGIGAAMALEAPSLPGSGVAQGSSPTGPSASRNSSSPAAAGAARPAAATNAEAIRSPGSGSTREVATAAGQDTPATLKLKSPFVPANYDGWRFAQYLQNLMLQKRPDLLLPSNGNEVNQVTIFLTEDGRVNREFIARIDKSELRQVPAAPDQNEIDRYAGVIAGRLDIDINRIGTYSVTYPARETWDPSMGMIGREHFILVYAWPRRAGESGPTFIPPNGSTIFTPGGSQSAAVGPSTDLFDAAAALAMVEQHMPDAFTGRDKNAGTAVIVLSRSGEFIRAGLVQFPGSQGGSKLVRDPLLLGIRTGEVSWRTVRNAAGASAEVLFAWQATDARNP